MFDVRHDSQHQPERLALVGSLTIYEVRQAHEALLGALISSAETRHWLLDLSELEELDSAGAQLLLALQHHLTQHQARLEVTGPAGEVLGMLELLRLQPLYPDVLPAKA